MNLWDIYLCPNVESSLLLFRDGGCVVVTENREDRVLFPWDEVFQNRKPGDLLLIIHNHLRIGRWSESDHRLYHRLREAGFKGEFLCRLGNGVVIIMED